MQTRHRTALFFAILLVFVLRWFVPYGPLILYPFTLLSTWVHEMGHGVTALLCGGRFLRLDIFWDASGLAQTAVQAGYRQALVAAGGLLAPPLVGAVLLALSRRFARGLLWLLALAQLASLVLWVRAPIGWAVLTPLLLVTALVARGGGDEGRLFFAQLLGVLLGLDTLTRMGYLFVPSARVGGGQHTSDIAAFAQVLGGPYTLWGGVLAGASVLLLLLGLLVQWRVPARRPARS